MLYSDDVGWSGVAEFPDYVFDLFLMFEGGDQLKDDMLLSHGYLESFGDILLLA